jgi:hypothetical protein
MIGVPVGGTIEHVAAAVADENVMMSVAALHVTFAANGPADVISAAVQNSSESPSTSTV